MSAEFPLRLVVLATSDIAVVRSHDKIVWPREIVKLDYEGKGAVVLGERAPRILPERVRECIAGSKAMNDVSGRDLQRDDHESKYGDTCRGELNGTVAIENPVCDKKGGDRVGGNQEQPRGKRLRLRRKLLTGANV